MIRTKFIVNPIYVPPSPEGDRTLNVDQVNKTVSSVTLAHSVSQTGQTGQKGSNLISMDFGMSNKAGAFLNGCTVLISGFDGGAQEEKLRYYNFQFISVIFIWLLSIFFIADACSTVPGYTVSAQSVNP